MATKLLTKLIFLFSQVNRENVFIYIIESIPLSSEEVMSMHLHAPFHTWTDSGSQHQGFKT